MTLKPKEQIYTLGFLYAAARVCTRLSYREAADTINLFLHRDSTDSVKLRTLSDRMNHIGAGISQELSAVTTHTLETYGFDGKTGVPHTDTVLSDNITGNIPDRGKDDRLERIQSAVDDINAAREEKIPFSAGEVLVEKDPSECIYISIDDIGVKRQKDERGEGKERKSRFVENTVAHIQHKDSSYTLTAVGMEELFRTIVAFLLMNNLLKYEIIFFTDGARNIKSCIEKYFSFHESSTILDWFHLKKKCMELLSMAVRGKEKRNAVLEKLLRHLWVGDVDGAAAYLRSLTQSYIKNQKCLEEVNAYLERKRAGITCYAVRKKLGLRNSSNPVEKANDLLVARRQKHNGMSWTPHGSGALAAIEMLYENEQAVLWFRNKQLSFLMPDEKQCA